MKQFCIFFIVWVLPIFNISIVAQNQYLNSDIEWETYSNPFFSIDYPASWRVLNNPDYMSDVAIGSTEELLGFTVLHINTEYSLSHIINDGNSNLKQAGIEVVNETNFILNGMLCNKTIYSLNSSMKQISYSFKNGETFYNIKFGNSAKAIDENMEIINRIINSIRIK